MGGTIKVESEYRKGSTFTVTFPQKIISDVEVGDFQKHFEENMKKAGKYKESFTAPEARILIVDDTRINLTVIVNLLKNTKMQIETAISGIEAVEKAETTAYDLILMDQRMPEMDGTEAFHKIRESENGASRNVPVICLTADAVIGAKERYLAEGFSDYLTKPVDSFALEKMLIRHLPKDKVELVKEEDNSDSAEIRNIDETKSEKTASETGSSDNDKSEEKYAGLRKAGFDVDAGLKYSQNEEDIYMEILEDYAGSRAEKTELMQKYYEAEDWKNYAIYVHALKSTSKMLGIMDLSEQAARLEAAGNAADAETIRKEHDSMLARYAEAAAAISEMLPEKSEEKKENSEDIFGEGEIFEFFPEDDEDNK